jgi:hypothetical protein
MLDAVCSHGSTLPQSVASASTVPPIANPSKIQIAHLAKGKLIQHPFISLRRLTISSDDVEDRQYPGKLQRLKSKNSIVG